MLTNSKLITPGGTVAQRFVLLLLRKKVLGLNVLHVQMRLLRTQLPDLGSWFVFVEEILSQEVKPRESSEQCTDLLSCLLGS